MSIEMSPERLQRLIDENNDAGMITYPEIPAARTEPLTANVEENTLAASSIARHITVPSLRYKNGKRSDGSSSMYFA